MKKAVALILIFSTVFCFVSCTDGGETSETTGTTSKIVEAVTDTLIDIVTCITENSSLCSLPTMQNSENVSITEKEKCAVESCIELTVEINPNPVIYGKNFVLTATATNYTGETIYICLPTSTENAHKEIDVEIKGDGGKAFVDLDTYGKPFDDMVKIISIKNGETITQVMNMAPGYAHDSGADYAVQYCTAGTYNGTAVFEWYDGYNPDTHKFGKRYSTRSEFKVPVFATEKTKATSDNPKVFTAEKDGIELTVELSSNPVKAGEIFNLTATVRNNSGKNIYVTLPTNTENMHEEIDVVIKDSSDRHFVDLDTLGKAFNEEVKIFTLSDGESITQEMNMAPGYTIGNYHFPAPGGDPIYYFYAGIYQGIARFNWRYAGSLYKCYVGETENTELIFDVHVV